MPYVLWYELSIRMPGYAVTVHGAAVDDEQAIFTLHAEDAY